MGMKEKYTKKRSKIKIRNLSKCTDKQKAEKYEQCALITFWAEEIAANTRHIMNDQMRTSVQTRLNR
jgi:hypothetical protein